MWLTLDQSTQAPGLVADATVRTLAGSSAMLVLFSVMAGLLALALTVRNAWCLRVQSARQAEDLVALQSRERRLRRSAHASEDGLVHLEPVRNASHEITDFLVTDANRRAESLFRRAESTMNGLRTSAMPALAPDTALFRDLVATFERGSVYRDEVRVHPRHATSSWLAVRAVSVEDGLAVTLTDIRERKREARRLRRASMTDELTGLINRRAFLSIAECRLREARAEELDTILFFIDCDGFKQINDGHGHPTGDRALREVARALRTAVRDTDVVARMGGDEFTLLAVDAVGDCSHLIVSRIQQQIHELNVSGRLPAAISLSIGHVRVPSTSTSSLEDLLEMADRDLLVQKRSRRATRSAIEAGSPAGRSPRARKAGKRAASVSQLTGAASAA